MWRAASAVWMVLVAVVSLLPQDAIGALSRTAGVAGHALAYAVLTYLLVCSGVGVRRAAVGAWCYGASIECLQMFSPGRTPEVADLLANGMGVVAAAWVLRRLHRRRAGPTGRGV